MASYNSAMPATAHRPAVFGAPVPMADPAAPAGTFAPGTKIQVGGHKVVIQKYFSEGGFAHVYLVKMPKPIDGTDIAVLKRVAVPDKENLANMRTEVETMKKLKGHRPIVTYYDSHASQLKGGGYEVFLLMEFCNGGGLIDFMNTRLQNRLTEPEILKIFSDVAEGVACMHYLKPPLLHRDLKVENVLITSTGSSKRFKLCDFGSTAPHDLLQLPLLNADLSKTISPEMIDVYRKQPIDEKADIWALGVLLYKLCYYTTPFEAQGQLAILNASFKFPNYPIFSDKLKKLIESRRNQQLPSPDSNLASPPIVGAVFAPPSQQQPVIPDVVPMRRGRPSAQSAQGHTPKPSPSPMRGNTSDPFAALDSQSPPMAVDEISDRFPSLDQFSLLHDGGKFDFESSSPIKSGHSRNISQRVTEKLADDAFASPAPSKTPTVTTPTTAAKPPANAVSRAQKIISSNPELQSVATSPSIVYQPTPTRPKNNSYVSQGTMTSPTPPPTGQPPVKYGPSPYRFPAASDHHRSASLPRNQEATLKPQLLRPEDNQALHPNTLPQNPSRSGHIRHPSSSRPSLDGGRPTDPQEPITRTKSSNARPRPSSLYLESNMDYLREKESSGRPSVEKRNSYMKSNETAVADQESDEETNIASNVDFLRTMEDNDTTKKDRRRSSGANNKSKRSSLPSLSGTKNLLAGKFGDAFKRFESNTNAAPGPRTPSPLHDLERRDLTPIAGSEATDGRSDDGNVLEDADSMAPEQRRELERRRLSMEEKRVANGAAEYRKRLADRDPSTAPRSIGGVTRAASIQNKVKNLINENQQTSPKKTAEGYGRFTSSASGPPAKPIEQQSTNPYARPAVARKPVVQSSGSQMMQNELNYQKSRPPQISSPATVSKTGGPRPNAPPKPMHLNSISTGPQNSPPKPSSLPSRPIQARPDMTVQEREDYVADFSKRFPSLSGIEMVETQIDREPRGKEI
ncbi:Actin-regulating kinase [Lachnellula willkommii]|uniref:non-specific serine/threonine protein kinase n=1 Tax=Lachnellula willkommii TaxID=215461 RepID=A0A559M370_9HELO|nr:Actin-regulating kinase [Lachnellula willkommii]